MSKVLLHNASQMVTADPNNPKNLKVLRNAFIGIKDQKIVYVGNFHPEGDWEEIDVEQRLVTPGLIDPHTHPIFAGIRADEYAKRLRGISYSEIAKSGGGIKRTVALTRAASDEELYNGAKKRLLNMFSHGTTTVEVKSGYGLSTEEELRQLRILKKLQEDLQVELHITFLGAHEIPEEYIGNRDKYLQLIAEEMLPKVQELGGIKFCDVFCETGVFTPEESIFILQEGKKHGLIPKIHANELSPSGGLEAACKVGAISADHLNYITNKEIELLAKHKTVPVLLPATSFTLGLNVYPPAQKLLSFGVPFALATDCNPGSCNCENLALVQTIACNTMRITPDIALLASTYYAAKALGIDNNLGKIEPDMQAELVIWDASDYREIAYHYGTNLVEQIMKKGEFISFFY